MGKTSWNAKHKWWHDVVVILLRVIQGAFMVLLGSGFLAASYYFWFSVPSPFNLVGGIPLLMIGLAFVLLGPLDFLQVVFSAKARRGICPFCHPVTLKDFFIPNSINNHFNGPKAHPNKKARSKQQSEPVV